jgi:hypothetical protein
MHRLARALSALASLRHWAAVMPMVLFERALKGGLGLVASKFGHGAARHLRSLQRVGGDCHANVREQVAGGTAETLLEMVLRYYAFLH